MIIYIVDFDEGKIIEKDFGDIADYGQFCRELDEMYDDTWFESYEDAVSAEFDL